MGGNNEGKTSNSDDEEKVIQLSHSKASHRFSVTKKAPKRGYPVHIHDGAAKSVNIVVFFK